MRLGTALVFVLAMCFPAAASASGPRGWECNPDWGGLLGIYASRESVALLMIPLDEGLLFTGLYDPKFGPYYTPLGLIIWTPEDIFLGDGYEGKAVFHHRDGSRKTYRVEYRSETKHEKSRRGWSEGNEDGSVKNDYIRPREARIYFWDPQRKDWYWKKIPDVIEQMKTAKKVALSVALPSGAKKTFTVALDEEGSGNFSQAWDACQNYMDAEQLEISACENTSGVLVGADEDVVLFYPDQTSTANSYQSGPLRIELSGDRYRFAKERHRGSVTFHHKDGTRKTFPVLFRGDSSANWWTKPCPETSANIEFKSDGEKERLVTAEKISVSVEILSRGDKVARKKTFTFPLEGSGAVRYFSELPLLAESGDIPAMKSLIDAGADVNVREYFFREETPLHKAVRRGHAAAVKFLIDAGADVAAKNRKGETPLYLAVQYERDDVVKILTAAGVKE